MTLHNPLGKGAPSSPSTPIGNIHKNHCQVEVERIGGTQ
jgi:hypothetical protein